MRLSVVLLLCSLAGVLAGGWLIGRVAFGCTVIFGSLCVGVWALARDDGRGTLPASREVPTLTQVLERARAS